MIDIPTLESLNLGVTLPALSLILGAIVLLLIDVFLPARRKHLTGWLALLGVLISLIITVANVDQTGQAFGGMFNADRFTAFVNVVVLLTAGIGILLAMDYLRRTDMDRTDYYFLLLFSTSGMMLMAAANDLIVIFIALELLSIPLYVLSGFRRPDVKSEESAMKYFLLGAFSSGFLVFGIALIYGATGTTALPGVWAGVSAIVESGSHSAVLLVVGASLILVALGFKVAAVPFHMWTPDVYEGAPTPVTAFMSVGAKAGGFAAMLRVLVVGLPTLMIASATAAAWVDAVAFLAVLTMIMGNVVAIMQTNLKRMLAYSSIAHAGYILMAVAAAGHPNVAEQGVQAALIYLLTYAFTNLGAFAVIIAVERNDGTGIDIDDLRGLARQRPWLALLMAYFMLSLTGIPLTAGFVGKWYVFWASISAGQNLVAVIGVLTSVVGAFYYVRVIVRMFLEEGDASTYVARLPRTLSASVIVAALGVLILGVLPFLVSEMGAGIQIALAALGGGG